MDRNPSDIYEHYKSREEVKLVFDTMKGNLESSHDKPVMQILDHLLSEEVRNQKFRHVEARIRYSGLPFQKSLDDFDFVFQPSLNQKTVDDLRTLRFVHDHENVVFLGPPGVGKTHLSVALGLQAIYSCIPAYYVSAVKLVQTMKKDYDQNRLRYRHSTYNRFPLMIVDEIGYLPLSMEESNLFFQFVSSRYEKRFTIYTSNKGLSEWGEILGTRSWHQRCWIAYFTTTL